MLRLMRLRVFGLWALALVGLAACQPEAVSPEASATARLAGRWQLTETDGGLSGRVQPADPGQAQEIVFDANGLATFFLNGVVARTTPYSLSQATSYVTGKPQTFVIYGTSGGGDKQFIEQISAARLVLVEDYADGFGYYYSRR